MRCSKIYLSTLRLLRSTHTPVVAHATTANGNHVQLRETAEHKLQHAFYGTGESTELRFHVRRYAKEPGPSRQRQRARGRSWKRDMSADRRYREGGHYCRDL